MILLLEKDVQSPMQKQNDAWNNVTFLITLCTVHVRNHCWKPCTEAVRTSSCSQNIYNEAQCHSRRLVKRINRKRTGYIQCHVISFAKTNLKLFLHVRQCTLLGTIKKRKPWIAVDMHIVTYVILRCLMYIVRLISLIIIIAHAVQVFCLWSDSSLELTYT